jgi:radical SAM protein with 4Fe4S-binding SPASM domain
MTDITEHLMKRNDRYYINTKTNSFNQTLKGLSVIEVCITELCTRKCGFCPRSDSKVYPNKKLFMSLETISNIGFQCKLHKFDGDFHFSGFGESLTHPDFFKLIKTLRNYVPENHIALTSNGDLLNADKCDLIYNSGINHIIISCYDGPDAYEKFDAMLSKFNKSYEIRKLWVNPDESMEEMVIRNKFNNRSGAVSNIDFENNKELFKNNSCYLPFYKLVIDYSGEILLCCNDWFRRHKGFGNINTTNLSEIWYSDEFKSVRQKLINGERTGPACSNCSIQGDVIGYESANILNE